MVTSQQTEQVKNISRETVAEGLRQWSREDLWQLWVFVNPLVSRVEVDKNKDDMLHHSLSKAKTPKAFTELITSFKVEEADLTFCQVFTIWLTLKSQLFSNH